MTAESKLDDARFPFDRCMDECIDEFNARKARIAALEAERDDGEQAMFKALARAAEAEADRDAYRTRAEALQVLLDRVHVYLGPPRDDGALGRFEVQFDGHAIAGGTQHFHFIPALRKWAEDRAALAQQPPGGEG